MRVKTKWMSILTTMLCLVPLITGMFGLGTKAEAEGSETVSVTLHKKKMEDFPINGIKNTGEEMDDFNKFEALEGAVFQAWDISVPFYAELDKTKVDVETLMKTFDPEDPKNAVGKEKVGGEQTTAEKTGNAFFENLPLRNSDGTYKVYYFQEVSVPDGHTKYTAAPLILVLPAKGVNGEELSTIHLYPKNQINEKEQPKKIMLDDNGDKIKDLPSKDNFYIFEVGKQINYKASFTIPSQIGEILTDKDSKGEYTRYSKFSFKDAVTEEGIKFLGISEIKIGGKVLKDKQLEEFYDHMILATTNGSDATYDKDSKAGFTLTANLNDVNSFVNATEFNKSKATATYLAQFANQKIEITYGVSMTEDTPVDQKIDNNFGVDMTHDGADDNRTNPTPPPGFGTGGRNFLKHEYGKDAQGLGGAKFIVVRKTVKLDEDGKPVKDGDKDVLEEKYLKQKIVNEFGSTPEWVEDISKATEFTSKNDGTFRVTGLEEGTYYLRETEAPNGFIKLTEDQKFEIIKGSFSEETALKISNAPTGGLPSTGGKGIIAFLVVGLGLMLFAINRYRKTRVTAV